MIGEAKTYLAVDLGASSGRVMLGRWDGSGLELEELHRFPNSPVRSEGKLRWDVEALWAEIKKGMALYSSRQKQPLTSIGVDSWGVDYGLLDAEGRLLDRPFHYRDHRTDGLMEEIVAKLGKPAIFEQTGLQFLPFNTLYQLYSQAQAHDPQLEKAAATLLMMPDLFHYRLSGRKAAEYTNATTTQFFSVREKRWATELLARLGISAHFLPPVVPPGTVLGELLPEVAAETGLNQTGPVRVVAPGTHDTASAVAGIPGLNQSRAFISSGTWSLVGVEIPEPVLDPAALELNFTNEGGVANTIRFLKNVMGLWLVQECQRIWQAEGRTYSWGELVQLSGQASPFSCLIDPDAPDFLNPENMPQAIRAYCQRTGQPQPDNPGAIIRCCLESLALKYRLVVEQLESLLGHRLEAVRVVGGGSQNEMLCQFTADASGREVIAGPVEATALGNIMVQAIATGQLSDLAAGREALSSSVVMRTYRPARQNEKEWASAFERLKRLVG